MSVPGEPGQTGPVGAVIFVLCLYTAANDGKLMCDPCYRSRSACRGDGMLERRRFGVWSPENSQRQIPKEGSPCSYIQSGLGVGEHRAGRAFCEGVTPAVCQSQRHLGPAWCTQM